MTKMKEKNNSIVVKEELDERKMMILLTIVKLYLETGEPVGSRTISKKLEVELSSATIRNEMSDLEEMGYIIKPHTSAGRIPSDKGYRFYVNNLISVKENEIKNLKAEMSARVDKLEDMMKTLVRSLATNTNYAAMISGPTINDYKLKYTQISNLEGKKVLIVVVAEGNIVKTNIVELQKTLAAKEILDISMSLNNLLSGMKVSEISIENIEKSIGKSNKNFNEILVIVTAIIESFSKNTAEDNIFTYGSNNFFKYKDLTDENADFGSLIEAFEQKKELAKFVNASNDGEEETGLNIYIGDESPVKSMKNCSIVTANCDFGNGMKGTIGIVGPKRMDYEKVLKTIKITMQNINKNLGED